MKCKEIVTLLEAKRLVSMMGFASTDVPETL